MQPQRRVLCLSLRSWRSRHPGIIIFCNLKAQLIFFSYWTKDLVPIATNSFSYDFKFSIQPSKKKGMRMMMCALPMALLPYWLSIIVWFNDRCIIILLRVEEYDLFHHPHLRERTVSHHQSRRKRRRIIKPCLSAAVTAAAGAVVKATKTQASTRRSSMHRRRRHHQGPII